MSRDGRNPNAGPDRSDDPGRIMVLDPVGGNGGSSSLPRISTGNPQADEILGGGFPVNSVNIIHGEPGTGKTIFAEQLAFHNADGDRPILYLTTLSEPLAKVVTYLQQFAFFDLEAVGDSVLFDDLGHLLASSEVHGLVEHVKGLIQAHSPRIIIIDSLRAVHDLAPSTPVMRRTVHDLAALVSAYDTTTFLLGDYSGADGAHYPEFAVADGIVEMLRRQRDTRDERYLRVRKLRGSAYWEGAHDFDITDRGLRIYPRLVMPEAGGEAPPAERVESGVTGVDEMIGGGLWRGSTTLVAGPSGAGKTSVALHFALAGLENGDSALYVNFQENPVQMARVLRGFGVDPDDARRRGLHLLHSSPVELQLGSIIVEIFDLVQERLVDRVVVDAVSDLAKTTEESNRLYDYLYTLVQLFSRNGVTALLTFEAPGRGLTGRAPHRSRFSYMSDNTLLLEFDQEGTGVRRTLRIVKSRGNPHDLSPRTLTIGSDGVDVIP